MPIVPPSPFRPKSRGAAVRSPSPPPLPPKHLQSLHRSVIDLNSSTGSYDRSTGMKVACRALLCDVVVEQLGEETTSLLTQLGETLEPTVLNQKNQPLASAPSSGDIAPTSWDPRKRDEMEHRHYQLTEELIRTERSYVSRIEALQNHYAAPLRRFARQGNTVIIPKYHAKTLFSNIDAVLPAAQSFLNELEQVIEAGQVMDHLGDLCLRHLKTLKTFEPYGTYIGNQDEAQKIFQELYRNDKSFVQFVDATKGKTTGIGNIGLRELLMEPVQRIPRYTMLWQSIAKCLPPHSEQRSKLLESVDIASRIARCEADEQTVRATVMYCLQRNIEGLPASLFSNHRNFIDSIDAEELLGDGGSMRATPRAPKSSQGLSVPDSGSPLHCTLFLFDDQLVIARRPTGAVSGRKMTGLDDIAKLVKTGGGVAVKEKDGMKKDRLTFRGAVDILKLTGMDLGGGDFQLVFDGHTPTTPVFADQSDRWVGRPVRSYSTIHPPQPAGFDPVSCKTDKNRFLSNLWAAQALCRTRPRHKIVEPVCRALVTPDDIELGGDLLRIKAYWNLWDRGSWTASDRKGKVVVQLTEDADVPELILPQEGGPALIIRLEAMPGAVCRLQAVTNVGQSVLRTATSVAEVNEKIIEAVNACDLFKVQKLRNTTTPAGTLQFSKRASRFGTDIARNLWGGSSASSRGHSDACGTTSTNAKSLRGHERAKSVDLLTISSISTNPPKTPRSDRSPISPASPISVMEISSNSGHNGYPEHMLPAQRAMSPMSLSPIKMPLQEMVSPRQGNGPQRSMSRVAAMRQELERKMVGETQETLASPLVSPSHQNGMSPRPLPSSARPLPSPGPMHESRYRKPVPTLASSVMRSEPGLSREPSLNSMPGSPTKGGNLSRSNTVGGPRAPRPRGAVPAPRSGYVCPLPPPMSPTRALSPEPTRALSPPPMRALSPSPGRSLPVPPAHPQPPRPGSAQSHYPYSPNPNSSLHSNHGHSALPSHSDHISVQSHSYHVREQAVEMLDDEPQPEPLRIVEATRTHNTSTDPRDLGLGAPPRRPRQDSPAAVDISPTAQKRAHDEEYASPRKRSASGNSSIMARVDSDGRGASRLGPATGPRRTSGKVAPRHASRSSPNPPHRQVSAVSAMSIASSLHTIGSAIDDDVPISDHLDLPTASDSARSHIADARKLARRIRMDATTMRKIRSLASESAASSLARSPSSSGLLNRNIHGMLDTAQTQHTGQELSRADMKDMDDLARHISRAGDKMEGFLKSALADAERVRMLARQIDESGAAYEATITTMEGQLGRAKEREELLQDQLRRRDLELEEIYNAFNTELDGMYNDMTLPQPEAQAAALRTDLQKAKNERNQLDMENKRLRAALEEERLKREQWSQLLHARGLL